MKHINLGAERNSNEIRVKDFLERREDLMVGFDSIREVKDEPEFKSKWEDLRQQWKRNEATIKYLLTPGEMYNDKYYKRHFEKYRDWEIAIAKYFSEKYAIESVVDFGCGVGSYLEGHVRAGVTKVKGFEYNYLNAKKYIPDLLQPHVESGDVTRPIDSGKFQCSWSVEVAEHILPDGTGQFIDNLVNASFEYILLTAAPPGQAGTGHINLRRKDFWIKAISEKGFKYLEADVEELGNAWKKRGAAWYVVRNLMLFKKEKVRN